MKFSRLRILCLLAVLALTDLFVEAAYAWDECKNDVQRIRSGTLTLGSITNETIGQYIYTGPVPGLDPTFPRDQLLTLTTEGCRAICNDPVVLNDAPTALSIAATWVFPLAILLNLPWESLHEKKFSKTLAAVSNWLGSPQTALTATIFNFRQIRDCHRRVKRAGLGNNHSNAFYVLSCLNQFDGLHTHPDESEPNRFLEVLIYGLFRPLSNQRDPDVELTRQLLSVIAFQLRMLRRRSVIPTLASLGTFLVAFVFSVVLAFAEFGDTAFSLALGLLVSWLPLLVIFTIVDRNPISAERSAELMSRWLFNVNAIREWRLGRTDAVQWWRAGNAGQEEFQVGEFLGQGRRLQYCGLVSAVLQATERAAFNETIQTFDRCAGRVTSNLKGWKPMPWYVVAILSVLLVWCEIMMAFMVAFNLPTVGIGCRSLSYLLFGGLSSISWFIQFSKRPPKWARAVSHGFNGLAILTLIAIITFQLTGVMNNCYCKSAFLNAPVLGGFIDFESQGFYIDHFNVVKYWVPAAVIGGLIPVVAFIVATFWWLKCQHLWSANERSQDTELWSVEADMSWLR